EPMPIRSAKSTCRTTASWSTSTRPKPWRRCAVPPNSPRHEFQPRSSARRVPDLRCRERYGAAALSRQRGDQPVAARRARRRGRPGIVRTFLPATPEGRRDLKALGQVVTKKCRLIAVTRASNVTGAVPDVGTIVAAARAAGAKVLLDGAQRAPHGPLDIPALG